MSFLPKQVDGVLAIHEFHVWQLAGNRIIASAHIRCQNLRDYMVIAEQVKNFFHNEGIHSTTIQPEFVEVSSVYCIWQINVSDPVCIDVKHRVFTWTPPVGLRQSWKRV